MVLVEHHDVENTDHRTTARSLLSLVLIQNSKVGERDTVTSQGRDKEDQRNNPKLSDLELLDAGQDRQGLRPA